MKPIEEMSIGELGAFVASHLRSRGIDTVLSGGACVMIYAEGKYVSRDLDLVLTGDIARRRLTDCLAEIGFTGKGRTLGHEKCAYLLDFRNPPLAVGKEPPKQVDAMTYPTGKLKLLSPTDCVKDRLANYYYFNDRQALEQARAVAQERKVDLGELKRWSEEEGMLDRYLEIEDRLRSDDSD
ncbi:MAG: hypothetical protein JXL80_00605 [Planctomycetes bacterium]|nr:hypothetical protein [Planctomycetota bacterium]